MAEYLVTWQIEVDADSPEEAASRARMYQRQPDSETNHFIIENKETGESVEVQLWPLDDPNKMAPRCTTCGGTEVLLDAFAQWDWTNQEWVLRSIYESPYCETCEDTCSYTMVKSN